MTLLAALLCAAPVNAKQVPAAGKDDASQSAYGGGWNKPGAGDAALVDTMKLGYLALFTSPGVPFLHGGEEFEHTPDSKTLAYTFDGSGLPGETWKQVCVLLNSDDVASAEVTLPPGQWEAATDGQGAVSAHSVSGKVNVPQKSGPSCTHTSAPARAWANRRRLPAPGSRSAARAGKPPRTPAWSERRRRTDR